MIKILQERRKGVVFKKSILNFVLFFPLVLTGNTYIATSSEEIQRYTNMLQAGDTLIVKEGRYNLNWYIKNLIGTPSNWIVITTKGDSVIINGAAYDNVVNIFNCSYIHFEGFELTTTNSGSGIDGIKFKSSSHYFTMEDLHIHDITGVGISANPNNLEFSYLTIRHCYIHDISDVGEGLYIGSHNGSTPVHHCLVELNWIHDCHPHKGIQFKRGTYLNIIQDNVVYNCDEAGIVLYKTDRPSIADNNIVRRNVIWKTPEGIFAVGQTDIDNNVIFDCGYGINTRNYSGWGMEDLRIRNNTIYHCDATCMMLNDWNNAKGEMACINNACYQDELSQSAIGAPDGIGEGIVEYNRYYGVSKVSGSILGSPPIEEFLSSSIIPGVVDLYPETNSTLKNSGTENYGAPEDDFNFLSRPVGEIWDVGAYEWLQDMNPGWQIQCGFKEMKEQGIRERVIFQPMSQILRIHPNPSAGKIDIKYQIGIKCKVTLRIYDVTGKRLCTLIDRDQKHGFYEISWKPKDLAGVYFCKLKAGGFVNTKKFILLRNKKRE